MNKAIEEPIEHKNRSLKTIFCSCRLEERSGEIVYAEYDCQNIWSSGNPFNDGKTGLFRNQKYMEEESRIFNKSTVPCFGFQIPAAVIELIGLMKAKCEQSQKFPNFPVSFEMTCCYDEYARGKPAKTMKDAIEILEKSNQGKANLEVARKFRLLLATIDDLTKNGSFKTMTVDAWSDIIFRILGIDIMTQLKNTEFLGFLGLDEETRKLFDLQTVSLLVKVVAGFKPEGCMSDIVNLVGVLTGKAPKDENAVVEMLKTFNAELIASNWNYNTKYNFKVVIMDAELDDWFAWLLLKLMGFAFKTYILLPAMEGEIEIDKVKYNYSLNTPSFHAFVELCRNHGSVAFEDDVSNLKALMRTFGFEYKLTPQSSLLM
jgi:hypothetical protein